MKKIISIVLIALLICMTLAGCGKQTNEEKVGSTEGFKFVMEAQIDEKIIYNDEDVKVTIKGIEWYNDALNLLYEIEDSKK